MTAAVLIISFVVLAAGIWFLPDLRDWRDALPSDDARDDERLGIGGGEQFHEGGDGR